MKKVGFTMSEVLITLSIIGVLATIMISSVIRNAQDSLQMAQFKKAYSMIENALQEMYIIEGKPSKWSGWPSTAEYSKDNANYFANIFKNYLPVQRYCASSTGCFNYTNFKNGATLVLKI